MSATPGDNSWEKIRREVADYFRERDRRFEELVAAIKERLKATVVSDAREDE